MDSSPTTLKRVLTYGTRAPRTVALDTANIIRLRTRSLDIADSAATIASLKARYKPGTVRTYVSAIINLMRATGNDSGEHYKRYRAAMAETHKLDDERYNDNPLTENQEANWMSWEELVAARDEVAAKAAAVQAPLNRTDRAVLDRHLLLSVFTMMPPRRNEYGTMEFARDKTRKPRQGNFYNMGENHELDYMVFNAYKTKKRYGRNIEHVPPELAKIVRRSLELMPRSHLFSKDNGSEAGGAASINRRFASAVPGKVLNCSLVRKIVKTTWDGLGLRGADRLAKKMGHSVGVADHYYNKNKLRQSEPAPNPMGYDL